MMKDTIFNDFLSVWIATAVLVVRDRYIPTNATSGGGDGWRMLDIARPYREVNDRGIRHTPSPVSNLDPKKKPR